MRTLRIIEQEQGLEVIEVDALAAIPQIRHISATTRGTWHRTSHCVVHVARPGFMRVYVPTAELPGILSARAIEESLTGRRAKGWTYGAIAKQIAEHAQLRELPGSRPGAIRPAAFHYQLCKPGAYPFGRLYDLRAAYWQSLERLPSPNLHISASGHISYRPYTSAAQAERWRRLLDEVGHHKVLRIHLVGRALGRVSDAKLKHVSFSRGQQLKAGSGRGLLPSLATYAIRAVYELTQRQVEELGAAAIYANVDCVVVNREDARPALWERLGFEYSVKGEGETRLVAPGVRRVGSDVTRNFADGVPERAFCSPDLPLVATRMWRGR